MTKYFKKTSNGIDFYYAYNFNLNYCITIVMIDNKISSLSLRGIGSNNILPGLEEISLSHLEDKTGINTLASPLWATLKPDILGGIKYEEHLLDVKKSTSYLYSSISFSLIIIITVLVLGLTVMQSLRFFGIL